MTSTVPMPPRPVALRPLALPAEHGGWGFVLEPIVLGLAVAPSWSGSLLALAALFGFLARQPLKLALQDALRGKRYPRTPYCWMLAASYALAASLALGCAVGTGGVRMLIPLGLVAPLALTQVLYDAHSRSRELLPELSGAAAMSSIAAAIAIAGGMRIVPAFVFTGIIVARTLPAILYVRTLLHGGARWLVIAAHIVALACIAWFATSFAAVAMFILLARAAWGLTHDVPPAKTVGWREIAFGVLTVVLSAIR